MIIKESKEKLFNLDLNNFDPTFITPFQGGDIWFNKHGKVGVIKNLNTCSLSPEGSYLVNSNDKKLQNLPDFIELDEYETLLGYIQDTYIDISSLICGFFDFESNLDEYIEIIESNNFLMELRDENPEDIIHKLLWPMAMHGFEVYGFVDILIGNPDLDWVNESIYKDRSIDLFKVQLRDIPHPIIEGFIEETTAINT